MEGIPGFKIEGQPRSRFRALYLFAFRNSCFEFLLVGKIGQTVRMIFDTFSLNPLLCMETTVDVNKKNDRSNKKYTPGSRPGICCCWFWSIDLSLPSRDKYTAKDQIFKPR